MNCTQAERLLYLHRPGERTQSEEKELERHLEQCASCRALAARVGRLETATGRLRRATPLPVQPEELTRSIMRRVKGMKDGERSVRVSILDRIIGWSSQGAVRFACASVLVCALCSGSYESIDFARHVQALEVHVGSSRGQPDLFQVVWAVPLEPLKAAVGNGRRWAEVSQYLPGSGTSTITVTRRLLEAALQTVGGGADVDRATARKVIRAAEEHAQRKVQFAREGA